MNKKEIFDIFYGIEKADIYQQFKKIEATIEDSNELYKYFDEIKEMLNSNKSYIKMRGFVLLCALSKWDVDNKINNIIKEMLNVLDDDKPTIVRMCLKSLSNLLLYKIELSEIVRNKLEGMDYLKYKDSMSPLIKKDIDYILNSI